MKRLLISASAAALGVWACRGDPTAALRGDPFRVTVAPDVMFIDEGDQRTVEVTVSDEQLNPLAFTATATSMNVDVFTVRADQLPSINSARRRFFVTALTPGQAMLSVQAAGLTQSATVNVLPVAFGGAGSTMTPTVGQEFTLSATALLQFSSVSDLNFADPADDDAAPIFGIVTARTVTSLTVLVPQPDVAQPAAVIVDSILVTYVAGLKTSLPTAALYNVQNPYDPNDAPDPAYTLTVPSSGGAPTVIYDGFKSSETDNFYTLTLAAPTTVTLLLEWSQEADIDMYVCDNPCAALASYYGDDAEGDEFAAATGSNPETATWTLPAGTHNVYINVFDNHEDPAHLYKLTVTVP